MIKLVNDPRLVMLGCAAVVTVPAVVALATVPVTLPPGIDDSPAPDPLNWDAVTVPVALTNPAVRMLPPVTLPVTLTAVPNNVPTTKFPYSLTVTTSFVTETRVAAIKLALLA
jgi:hypothetical protein